MTNHVHLLATPENRNSTAQAMQWLGRIYVRYYNLDYRRSGTLWEGRYRSCLIQTERYLECQRYIELNPLRADTTVGVR
jgi:putative transposase